MSYILIPELQYWVNDHIVNSTLNRQKIPIPIAIPITCINRKSFIELLFNEDYSMTSYEYLYIASSFPCSLISRRLGIYSSASYFHIDENVDDVRINIFSLNDNDIIILDKLLEYRLDPDNTTLDGIPIDSTAFDGLSNLTSPADSTAFQNYDTVSPEPAIITITTDYSNLYNLIYLYLDLKINNNTQYYDNMLVISHNNTGTTSKDILECCYESFLIEQMFQYTSSRTV